MFNLMISNKMEVSVLTLILVSLMAHVVLSSSLAGGPATALTRVKREGLGPWEAQDAWDEKGKSIFEPVLNEIVAGLKIIKEEEAAIINVTKLVTEEIKAIAEHPVSELLKTNLGTIILVAAVIGMLALVIRIVLPVVEVLWTVTRLLLRGISFVAGFLFDSIYNMSCCMTFCALAPLVRVRNAYRTLKMRRDDRKRMQVFSTPGDEVELITKTVSRAFMDEDGVYLEAGNGRRVYLDKAYETEDLIRMNFAAGFKRDANPSSDITKETIISTSKLYKVDKIPDFQGQFEVEGTLVGHFSRIKFQNKDCILTAYHVLEYNKAGLLSMTKNGKKVRMESVRSRIICASPSDDLDFVIMEMPGCVFSTLGLKLGQWCLRAQPREPISIYQEFEGKPCVSSATVGMSDTKPWHVKYGASTTSGTSGAPILNARSQIVGIHLEHDASLKCNVGVIPPVFRNYRKESPANNDIAHAEDDLVEYEKYADEFTDEEWQEMMDAENDEIYRMAIIDYEESIAYDSRTKSWAEQMDEIDVLVDSRYRKTYGESYDDKRQAKIFHTKTGKTGRNVNQVIKRGRVRKESPWTCSKCFTIHKERGYGCVNCGYALVKKKVAKSEKLSLADQVTSNLPDVVQRIIKSQVMSDYIDALIADRVASLVAANRLPPYGATAPVVEPLTNTRLWPDLSAQDSSTIPNRVVKVDERLAQDLRTSRPIPRAPLTPYAQIEKVQDKDVIYEKQNAFNQTRSEQEGGISFSSEQKTPLATVEIVSKSARRRKRKAANKETIVPSGSNPVPPSPSCEECRTAVPLNSKAPAQTGAITTPGTSQSPSQTSPSKSGKVAFSCLEQERKPKVTSGKLSKNSTLSTKNTDGQTEVQRPKRSASNCSATGTSQTSGSQVLRK